MLPSRTVTEARITAKVIRADGTEEDLGTVAYWNANPVKVLLFHMKKILEGKRHGNEGS